MVIETVVEIAVAQGEPAHRWPIGTLPAWPQAVLDGAIPEADQPPEGQEDDEQVRIRLIAAPAQTGEEERGAEAGAEQQDEVHARRHGRIHITHVEARDGGLGGGDGRISGLKHTRGGAEHRPDEQTTDRELHPADGALYDTGGNSRSGSMIYD